MKKSLLISILFSMTAVFTLSGISALASPASDFVVMCTDGTGTFPHRLVNFVLITQNPDPSAAGYSLKASTCTGWGCVNKTGAYAAQTYEVNSCAPMAYVGDDVSFERTPDGGFQLKSSVLDHEFAPSDCEIP